MVTPNYCLNNKSGHWCKKENKWAVTQPSSSGNFDTVNHNRLPMMQVSCCWRKEPLGWCVYLFFFHISDPIIDSIPTAEVDPTIFEKRFLRKIRELGEVRCFSICTIDLLICNNHHLNKQGSALLQPHLCISCLKNLKRGIRIIRILVVTYVLKWAIRMKENSDGLIYRTRSRFVPHTEQS